MDIVETVAQMIKVENVTNTGINAQPFPVTHGYDAWLSVISEI